MVTVIVPGSSASLRSYPLETGRISVDSLKPGMLYNIVLSHVDENGIIQHQSKSTPVVTYAAFQDENIDDSDPFIIRSNDDLFVADNDNLISFIWSAWPWVGIHDYFVTIYEGSSENEITSLTTTNTSVTITGEVDKQYGIAVTPRMKDGSAVGSIVSRFILCNSSGLIVAPGSPRIISTDK